MAISNLVHHYPIDSSDANATSVNLQANDYRGYCRAMRTSYCGSLRLKIETFVEVTTIVEQARLESHEARPVRSGKVL